MLQWTLTCFGLHVFISYAFQMRPGISVLFCGHKNSRNGRNWHTGKNSLFNGCRNSIRRSCTDRSVWNNWDWSRLLCNVYLLRQRLLTYSPRCCSHLTLCEFVLGKYQTWMISEFIDTRHCFNTIQYPVRCDNVNWPRCFTHWLVLCLINNSSRPYTVPVASWQEGGGAGNCPTQKFYPVEKLSSKSTLFGTGNPCLAAFKGKIEIRTSISPLSEICSSVSEKCNFVLL